MNKYIDIFTFILLILIFKVTFSYQFDNSNLIQIRLNCNQVKSPILCDKVKNAFINAAIIILNTFEFKEPIIVKADFTKLCDNCNKLGSAGPAKLISLKDDDEKIRLYSQALVKQLQLTNNYEFTEYDIVAEFNSEIFKFLV